MSEEGNNNIRRKNKIVKPLPPRRSDVSEFLNAGMK